MVRFEEEIKYIFKKHKLGRICKIYDSETRWAKGKIYIVTTWLKKYIVIEQDGHVKTVKTLDKIYYSREGAS